MLSEEKAGVNMSNVTKIEHQESIRQVHDRIDSKIEPLVRALHELTAKISTFVTAIDNEKDHRDRLEANQIEMGRQLRLMEKENDGEISKLTSQVAVLESKQTSIISMLTRVATPILSCITTAIAFALYMKS